MAKLFLVDIDLNQNEIQNPVLQNLANDPANAILGQFYINSGTKKLRVFNGTTWDEMGSGGGTVTSVNAENDTDGGMTITGGPITDSGTFKIGHSNKLQSAQTTSGVYPIKIDKNGHITEIGTAIDFDEYAKLNSPAFTGTPTAPTAASGTNTTQLATTAFVQEAVSDLESAVKFRDTVTGGTLPTTGVKNGDMYIVGEAGTYDGHDCKVGDQFIASVSGSTITWKYIPSGDENEYKKHTGTITGNGTDTSFTITHNFDTRDLTIQVYDATTYEDVVVDIERTTANAIKVSFASAPTSSESYKVVIIG